MIRIKQFVTLLLIFLTFSSFTQNEKRYKIHTIAFYNLENLFDTINDPLKNDEASPMMEMAPANRGGIYKKKVVMQQVVIKMPQPLTAQALV